MPFKSNPASELFSSFHNWGKEFRGFRKGYKKGGNSFAYFLLLQNFVIVWNKNPRREKLTEISSFKAKKLRWQEQLTPTMKEPTLLRRIRSQIKLLISIWRSRVRYGGFVFIIFFVMEEFLVFCFILWWIFATFSFTRISCAFFDSVNLFYDFLVQWTKEKWCVLRFC